MYACNRARQLRKSWYDPNTVEYFARIKDRVKKVVRDETQEKSEEQIGQVTMSSLQLPDVNMKNAEDKDAGKLNGKTTDGSAKADLLDTSYIA